MQEIKPYDFSFYTFVTNPVSKSKKQAEQNVNAFMKQGGTYRTVAYGGCGLGGLVLFFGFFAIALINPTVGIAMIVGGVFGGWLFYYIVYIFWRLMVGATYGPARCMLSATDVKPGDTLTVVYAQDVLKDVELLGGEIQLIVREAVEYSCGTDTCHDHVDQIVDSTRMMPQRLMKGLKLQEKASFTIPPNAMPTFASANNKIGWLVRVMFESEQVAKYELLYYFNVVQ